MCEETNETKKRIKDINLKSWEEFEEELSKLFSDKNAEWLLFRGQSNSCWGLETTLDRRLKGKEMSLAEYYGLMLRALPRVEEETGRHWNLQEFDKYYREVLDASNKGSFFEALPGYEFMVYLRHHGFPSPLLDWTASPFIATFFAYREEAKDKRVSIYAYRRWVSEVYTAAGGPNIYKIETTERTHRRHYLQQSHYTICAENRLEGAVYAHHEDAVRGEGASQDVVKKYCIPSSEREKVLLCLRRCNINSFSLFGTEESLMNTLWSDIELDYLNEWSRP